MKSFTIASLALSLLGSASARPPVESRDVQQAHFTFHAADASYSLTVPADGTVVHTNSDLNVNIIDIPDYNAQANCHFTYAGPGATDPPALDFHVDEDGTQQLLVGTPTVITSVSCQGVCLGTYSNCYDPQTGMSLGVCCAGFCAANKCRPWQ